MSATFGEPTFGIDPGVGTDAAAPLVDSSPQDVIDPNDPRLVSESMDVNVDGDAYAQPAPPPDGRYRVKLKLQPVDDKKGGKVDYTVAVWGKDRRPCYVTALECSIIDPTGKHDGLKVFERNVSTFAGRDGSTKVATILARLKRPDGSPWVPAGRSQMSQLEWMQLFVQAMAGEPEIGIETTWEFSCQACGEAAKAKGERYPRSVVGMHKFPPEQDAAKRKLGQVYSPEMKCGVNPAHGYSRARVIVNRFIALAEMK